MSGDNDTVEAAKRLLMRLCQVRQWVLNGDPQAQPYLDADACRVVIRDHDERDVDFHPQRFDEVDLRVREHE